MRRTPPENWQRHGLSDPPWFIHDRRHITVSVREIEDEDRRFHTGHDWEVVIGEHETYGGRIGRPRGTGSECLVSKTFKTYDEALDWAMNWMANHPDGKHMYGKSFSRGVNKMNVRGRRRGPLGRLTGGGRIGRTPAKITAGSDKKKMFGGIPYWRAGLFSNPDEAHRQARHFSQRYRVEIIEENGKTAVYIGDEWRQRGY